MDWEILKITFFCLGVLHITYVIRLWWKRRRISKILKREHDILARTLTAIQCMEKSYVLLRMLFRECPSGTVFSLAQVFEIMSRSIFMKEFYRTHTECILVYEHIKKYRDFVSEDFLIHQNRSLQKFHALVQQELKELRQYKDVLQDVLPKTIVEDLMRA